MLTFLSRKADAVVNNLGPFERSQVPTRKSLPVGL